jgi:hypothetical protein
VMLTTYLHVVLRSGIHGTLPSHPHTPSCCVILAEGQGSLFDLILYINPVKIDRKCNFLCSEHKICCHLTFISLLNLVVST